jgi:predicted Zn-dependent peptidase
MSETAQIPPPARTRAVFSREDFGLIRTAIAHYLREVQDQPESVKYANLYHRLGRVS